MIEGISWTKNSSADVNNPAFLYLGTTFRVVGSGALSIAVGTDLINFTALFLDQFLNRRWLATSPGLSHEFVQSNIEDFNWSVRFSKI